jgi:hypothetical protein
MKSQYRLMLFVGLSAALLSSCGKTNILKSVNLQVSDSGSGSSPGADPYLTLTANLNLGNAVFDQLQVPVLDPRSGRPLGLLSLSALPDGSQQVSLGVSASAALNADPVLGLTLPNGRELPLSLGVRPGEMLAFPILNHSRIYIGGDLRERATLGVALAIRQLDGIANQAGMPLNLFFGMNVNPSLYGTAGLYGSPSPNQSGVAVLARLNRAEPQTVVPLALARSKVRVDSLAHQVSDQATSDTEAMDSRSERRVVRFFHGAPRKIRVH